MPAIAYWPGNLLPAEYDFGLVANTQSGGVSPFDKSEQTLEQPGARWTARLKFDCDRDEAHQLSAFVNLLRGRAGRFYWGPPSWRRRGSAPTWGGASVINGNSQTGELVQFRGFTPNKPDLFYPGDLVSWVDGAGRPYIHQCIANGAAAYDLRPSGSDGSGLCSIRVSPPIRRSPPDGAVLYYANPLAVWRLNRDDIPVTFSAGMFGTCTIDIQEALF